MARFSGAEYEHPLHRNSHTPRSDSKTRQIQTTPMVAAVSTVLKCHLGHHDSWGCVAAGWHTKHGLQESSWFENGFKGTPNFHAWRSQSAALRRPN